MDNLDSTDPFEPGHSFRGILSFVLPFIVLSGVGVDFLVYKKIYPTIKHIVFAFRSHKIIHFNTIGNRTTASKEILFSQVAKVMHVSRSAVAAVVLLLDQKTLVVNEGTPTETKPFAEKIAGFLDVPIEEYRAISSKDYGDWFH